MTAAITVNALRKTYGPLTAVDGIGFEVGAGEIFGMVGPNGAGKTTTIECLEGMRAPDSGDVRILGLDPRRDGYPLRERIGVQLQQSALPDDISVCQLPAAVCRRGAVTSDTGAGAGVRRMAGSGDSAHVL